MSKSIMQEAYVKVDEDVKAKLQTEVQSICLTADMWTSLKTESYIALTGHYLTEGIELKTVLLGCCHFPGHHTADNIAAEINTLVETYEVKEKVNFMVTDNAANIVKAVKEVLGWKHFGCYTHSLNLIVEHALHLTKQQVDKVKRNVTHIKKRYGSRRKYNT